MVTSKEQAIDVVREAIKRIAELDSFEGKLDVIDKLLDIEWSLGDLTIKGEDLPEEFRGKREAPWSD